MNAPYEGEFRVSQPYKGAPHKGIDLVGITSKAIHSTVDGTVVRAGWENPNNHAQGYGQRVVVRQNGTDLYFFYAHLSEIHATVGQAMHVGDVLGFEGSTGHSTGGHLHYECRRNDNSSLFQDISALSGIPNEKGTYDADKPACPYNEPSQTVGRGLRGDAVRWVQWQLRQRGYDIGAAGVDGICGNATMAAIKLYQSKNGLDVDGLVGKLTRAKLR
jgi:murein DD-endopeptidase MepM/ murein hydrolase activator NlpD